MSRRGRVERSEKFFGGMLAGAVALGAVVRLVYVLRDRRYIVSSDGLDYHLGALRLADGFGYTSALGGDVGAPYAHHPPGWVTILGVVSWFGGRTQQQHQLVGVAFGLGVVLLAGLVGRRYFTARIGIIAAVVAALYPGFWVLEGNMLSEPLSLFIFGTFLLVVAGVRERPTVGRSIAVGALVGRLALVRSEQLLLLIVVVVPVLLRLDRLAWRRRAVLAALAALTCAITIAPWSVYNETRFDGHVLLSTNGGGTLLSGNCPPWTYEGEHLGHYVTRCIFEVSTKNRGHDRSEVDPESASAALANMSGNISRLPVVVPARYGRALAAFRPSQTVGWVSSWMQTDRDVVWAWVASFWMLVPLALLGILRAPRARAFLLPLLGPVIIVLLNVAVSYGEPRSHTPADLSVVVLAAVGIDFLASKRERLLRSSAAAPNVPAPAVPAAQEVICAVC